MCFQPDISTPKLPPPPVAKPPASEAELSAAARDAADAERRRRGRSALIVNPNGPLGGTGLNIAV